MDRIETNLNAFAASIGASGIDWRVIVIGADSAYCADSQCFLPVCVPPPLSGAAGCPDTDSDRYRHVRRGVHSRDGLLRAEDSYAEWRGMLRPDAVLHMVFVTDDNHAFNRGQDAFLEFMQDPARVPAASLLRVHSVVDEVGSPDGCGVFGDDCSCGENRGSVYIDLSERTGGTVHSICEDDWSPVFSAVEERIGEDALVPCTYALPPLGFDELFDRVNVTRETVGGGRAVIPWVEDASACDGDAAWHFDDSSDPAAVVLCDAACDASTRRIEVEIGCETVKR